MDFLSKKSIQLPAIYRIRPGNGSRMCQECINDGFCRTHYSNGIKIQWNGFMLFYNGDYKTTDVVLDIAGHRAAFNISNASPLDLVNGLGSDSNTRDKIHSTLKSNDFWKNVSNNGVRLEQVIGYEILEKDVQYWDEQNADDFRRNNYIKKIKLDQCLEVSLWEILLTH
uniref:Uncharacterized protein n=1 Tax=Meloidogyne enterolobii TaxID=390850 RepID=A0A6V7WUV3_MELEN|nr:unnamed protein product [Meloidogyne enterolobii]